MVEKILRYLLQLFYESYADWDLVLGLNILDFRGGVRMNKKYFKPYDINEKYEYKTYK